MNELLKTLKLAAYVCALPLIATAVASAHHWIHTDDPVSAQQAQLEELAARPAVAGSAVQEFAPSRAHVAIVDQGGGITGRVVISGDATGTRFGAPGMRVSLNRRGRVVSQDVSGADGKFRLENVTAGAYTFMAVAPHAIVTFGVYVLADDEGQRPAADTIQGDVMVAHANVQEVRRILNSDVDVIEYGYHPKTSELHVVEGANRATLTEDGRIVGRVVPLEWLNGTDQFDMTGNNVYLFHASGLVANVPLQADGSYTIEGLQAGLYDFVSFGPHGAAAFALEVLPHGSTASVASQPTMRFASSARMIQAGVDAVLSEPTAGTQQPDDFQIPPPPPPPPFAGPGGGAGAYSSGFGDWAGLIGAGLAAWALAEGLSNDDGRFVTAPVVLPPVIPPPPMSPF